MSDIRCPNCNKELSLAALSSDWCENCGKKIPAFIRSEAGSHSPSPASVNPSTAVQSRETHDNDDFTGLPFDGKKVLSVLILSAFALAIVGGIYFLITRPDALIHVDNGGRDALAVFMDDSQKLTVGPQESKSFTCRSGSHRFVVKRGDKVVFDETHSIEGHNDHLRNYLLNPEATNRYCSITFDYGFGFGPPSAPVVPVAAWVDVNPDLVFERAPSSVSARTSSTRKVLQRVSFKDYDALSRHNEDAIKRIRKDSSE